MTPIVEVGSIVRIAAPGTRGTDGRPRIIPAVVLGQWPDGSLQLYAMHYEGSNLVYSIPLADVEIVFSRSQLVSLDERLTELEKLLPKEIQHLKFSLADGTD